MNNKVKNILLLVLAIGLIAMTGAYALLSQNLSIRSTGTLKGASWDIHIEDLTGPSYKVGSSASTSELSGATATDAVNVIKTPTAKTTSLSGFVVQFTKPNASVSYTFDLVNAGTLDAKLDSYSIAGRTGDNAFTCEGTAADSTQAAADAALVCSHLTYTLKYSDGDSAAGTDVAVSNTLDKATGSGTLTPTRRNVTLTLTLADMETLPSADVNVSGLDVDFNYVQK